MLIARRNELGTDRTLWLRLKGREKDKSEVSLKDYLEEEGFSLDGIFRD